MSEYRYDFDRPQFIPSGRLVLNVANVGKVGHEVVMFRLADDSPPIEELFTSGKGGAALTIAQVVRDPGRDASIALDLTPGRYALVCFLTSDSDDINHRRKGMSAELRII